MAKEESFSVTRGALSVTSEFELLWMPYLSHVIQLLLPLCQPLASLLLLSEGLLGLCTELHVFNDFADLFALFGRAFGAV